ncbi:DUF1801 domain-containing protein [uncultured Demequina sp.]|uniref:DUF1801 domain-containing protein n=1 Tax=uncultured Demequina sp. TaxID=693499 RepID=UPI0025FC8491|nr:DUF1801 domain-containing protein [uncultured Demequina sp.]
MTSDDVERWMGHYDNPMKDVVQRIRQIILASDDRIEECIKWQTPTFTYKGNLASFFPKSTHHATLMFHQGALIPGHFPHLEGGGKEGRAMKIVSIAEAEERRDELNAIIQAWIAWKDAAGA